MKSWREWFGKLWFSKKATSDRRRAMRQSAPAIRAHLWSGGGVPEGREIGDISPTGLYLFTNEPWYPGTIVTITLQKEADPNDPSPEVLSVTSRIVRQADGGCGCEFIFPSGSGSKSDTKHDETVANRGAVERFLE